MLNAYPYQTGRVAIKGCVSRVRVRVGVRVRLRLRVRVGVRVRVRVGLGVGVGVGVGVRVPPVRRRHCEAPPAKSAVPPRALPRPVLLPEYDHHRFYRCPFSQRSQLDCLLTYLLN